MSGPDGALRSVRQPGLPAAQRATTVPVAILPIDATLPAGPRLLDALAALLAEHGAESACVTLDGGALAPFAYVIPALSPDGTQAAFYSDTFRPAGASALEVAAVTVGTRDGQPFFHCHGLWTEMDGRRGCGHILPDETVIARSVAVRGAGILGARFEAQLDAETGFRLFAPVATGTPLPPNLRQGVAVRLAPNQDLGMALAAVGRQAGFPRAVVRGGVASTIGARFTDAPPMEGFATELLVRHGTVQCGAEAAEETVLDIVIVDLHGSIASGRLVYGDNPVLMTFEGVLEAA